MKAERIEEIRKRYEIYGETKNIDHDCSVHHIRELLDALREATDGLASGTW